MFDIYNINIEDIINDMYGGTHSVITKNKGNTGYFIKSYNDYYYFITKKEILNYICRTNYIDDERMIKLISLKI